MYDFGRLLFSDLFVLALPSCVIVLSLLSISHLNTALQSAGGTANVILQARKQGCKQNLLIRIESHLERNVAPHAVERLMTIAKIDYLAIEAQRYISPSAVETIVHCIEIFVVQSCACHRYCGGLGLRLPNCVLIFQSIGALCQHAQRMELQKVRSHLSIRLDYSTWEQHQAQCSVALCMLTSLLLAAQGPPAE